jgi:hypothetical protein
MHLGIRLQVAVMIAQAGQWFYMDNSMAAAPTASAPSDRIDGVVVGSVPPRRDFLHLDVTDLYIGFETEYESRRVRSSVPYRRDTTHENRDLRLHELLGLSFIGDVGDPNLLEYRGNVEFGLSQNRFVEEINGFRDTDRDNGFLQRYDVSLDAFKTKPISLNAYARRADDRIARRFLPSLREIRNEAGISALALTGPVTTELGYSYSDVDRTGNRLREDDESLTNSRLYLDSKWDISDTHKLHLTYDHEREENSYQGSRFNFDTNRDELRLDHELAFGPGDKHRLDTFLRYNAEKGDLARDEFEFTPRLTLKHTDKFKTIYRYGLYRFDQAAIDLAQHKFDAQALYEPTDHWRLSLDTFGLYERVDRDVETQQYGVNGDITYHRPTSLGELSADLHLGYDQARTTGDAGRRYVRNEAHALGGVRPVFLRQQNVVLTSIIARDAKFTRIFVIGADFTVLRIGTYTVIQRVPWGRIAEGDVIYFDYQYTVPAEASIDTYRADFRIEHAFKFGLTPYYYFESRFQDVDRRSIGTPLLRDNQDRHRIGARYGRQRWNVTGEYEIFDDSIEPYDAFHFTGQMSLFRSTAHSLDLNGEISRYFFEGGFDRRRVWFMDLNLKDRMDITHELSINAGTELRREDDSVRGKTTGVDLECGLRWIRGYLTVELNVEYDLLSVVENRESGFGVFLNVRRDLSHLLPSRKEAQ